MSNENLTILIVIMVIADFALIGLTLMEDYFGWE